MDTLLTCTACGHTGYDVRSRIVATVDDALVRVGDFEVPERYRHEPHCIDRDACLERQSATALKGLPTP
jgi:hypothetical protein